MKLTNFSFGGTSATITNLSLIIGLGSTDVPKATIVASLFIIAVADNISDSLGIHIYKESESCGMSESFISTVSNFTTRLLVSLVFIALVLYFPIQQAQVLSIAWGLLTLSLTSYLIAVRNRQKPFLEILKHLGIAVLVIAASKYIGVFIHAHSAMPH